MEGIQFVIDETGRKSAVQIDLSLYGELWKNFYNSLLKNKRLNKTFEKNIEDSLTDLNKTSLVHLEEAFANYKEKYPYDNLLINKCINEPRESLEEIKLQKKLL